MKGKTLLITGAAGYVGAMLVHQFSNRNDVETIICIDKEQRPDLLTPSFLENAEASKKIVWIQANTSDAGWEEKVAQYTPDIIIHTAWQIREMYGKKKLQWKWNVEGSQKVFEFAFSTPSVKKLIHMSTVASYGARPDNTIEHRFKESEGFRKSDYLYAEEKRVVEEKLFACFEKAAHPVEVSIVRPAAITGPRGRYMRLRFGLQSVLSGQMKDSFLNKCVSALVAYVPATKKWCRQFIHEDDICNIIELLAFTNERSTRYEAFNACPPGAVVTAENMAAAVGKKTLNVPPRFIQVAFFFMWHLTRGRIPTSRGGWKSYSYPIAVDGSKISQMYSYSYGWSSLDAFTKREGRYMKYIKD